MRLNLTVFLRRPGSREMWQRQEGCEMIASVITVTGSNLALTGYLISSLFLERCVIIALSGFQKP